MSEDSYETSHAGRSAGYLLAPTRTHHEFTAFLCRAHSGLQQVERTDGPWTMVDASPCLVTNFPNQPQEGVVWMIR